jgi:alkylation response protein AidB-like acyl-CoA dehydrogenase
MNFHLTTKQQHWQQTARGVSQEVLALRAAEVDLQGAFPRENFAALAGAHLLGLPVPEELNGPGGDILTTTLVTEELARGCGSTALCYHMHIAATTLIAALAKGDQVDQYVLPILAGKHISTYAISEPGSGSRWWHMVSHATKRNGCYLIDSYKSFATSAGQADSYILPVRATSESSPHELSLFVIDSDTPAVKPVGTWNSMGMRGNCSTPVHFDNITVPESCRLGEAAFGFPLLMAYGLPVYQIGLAAVYLGLSQSALDFALSHVTKRVHVDTGLPLAKVETVQRYIAEMKLRIDQTRLFVYNVASYIDELSRTHGDMVTVIDDSKFLEALSEVKVVACEAANAVTSSAVQLCGGLGYSKTHSLERCFRDARAGSIMGPNDDMLKLIIGQQVLGLPLPWES